MGPTFDRALFRFNGVRGIHRGVEFEGELLASFGDETTVEGLHSLKIARTHDADHLSAEGTRGRGAVDFGHFKQSRFVGSW
jgi:hypothetical protein